MIANLMGVKVMIRSLDGTNHVYPDAFPLLKSIDKPAIEVGMVEGVKVYLSEPDLSYEIPSPKPGVMLLLNQPVFRQYQHSRYDVLTVANPHLEVDHHNETWVVGDSLIASYLMPQEVLLYVHLQLTSVEVFILLPNTCEPLRTGKLNMLARETALNELTRTYPVTREVGIKEFKQMVENRREIMNP